ncbi:MAG: hypothetical protein RIE77_09245 [Phycisphaerales bacterium]
MTRNRKANLLYVGGGAVLGLSALVGLYLAAFSIENLVWPMLLFEPVLLGCGIGLVLVGLGYQRDGLPMTLATIAGCAAIAGFLSTVAGRNTLGSTLLVPMLGGRLLIAAALGVWAIVLVLGPRASAWRRVALGALLLLVGGGLASLSFIGPAKPLRESLVAAGGFVSSAVALVVFIVFVVLVAAGVHLMVRPFEMALDAEKSEKPAAS